MPRQCANLFLNQALFNNHYETGADILRPRHAIQGQSFCANKAIIESSRVNSCGLTKMTISLFIVQWSRFYLGCKTTARSRHIDNVGRKGTFHIKRRCA